MSCYSDEFSLSLKAFQNISFLKNYYQQAIWHPCELGDFEKLFESFTGISDNDIQADTTAVDNVLKT